MHTDRSNDANGRVIYIEFFVLLECLPECMEAMLD